MNWSLQEALHKLEIIALEEMTTRIYLGSFMYLERKD